jgi:uncharacterized Zn finger protein (UPF0148 family)
METCSNCGATLRPGARFCTTCGTRLNPTSTTANGWSRPAEAPAESTQDTSVLEAVKPPAPQQPAQLASSNEQREYDRWTSAYGSPTTPVNDPASRFISALEQDSRPATPEPPAEETQGEKTPTPATTWVTPPPEAFGTGRPSTWNFEVSSQDDETWKAPSTWNTVGPVPDETEVERTNDPSVVLNPILPSSGREEDAGQESESEIEALPEVAEATDVETAHAVTVADVQPAAVEEATAQDNDEDEADIAEVLSAGSTGRARDEEFSPTDARARAISMVDELRRMIRMMPGGNLPDMGAAAMALTEASLNVTDFGDVREAITELQDDPRDIQALSNLARLADKIELLLNEHQALADAIETALQEMSGLQ